MSVTNREVTEDEADIRLDRWFRRHFPGLTQGAIQKLCRTGQVRVDGKRAEAATRLAPGQAVRIPPIPAAPMATAAPPTLDPGLAREVEAMVLWRDDHIIVLNKPPGLPTQGGPGIGKHLDMMLEGLRDGEHKPRLVHRLDKDTSGVLVVARTPGVAAKLASAFRGRTVEKIYWAVVAGRPVPVEGRIERELDRIDGYRGERAAVAGPIDTETAHTITDYRTLAAEAVDAHQLALDAALDRHRAPRGDGPIDLLHRAAAEGAGELGGHARSAGDDQDAGGILVQPVHQPRLVLAVAQAFQHHVEMLADAGPALGGQAGRLVQHDDVIVAPQHHGLDLAGERGVERRCCDDRCRGRRDRRHADGLPWREAGGRLGPLAIDADLAGAAQLLDRALGQAREVAAEPAVEPDIGFVLGHFPHRDAHGLRSPRSLAQ